MPRFDDIYLDYADYVQGLAYRLCGPGSGPKTANAPMGSEADDLFQEVFLRIYRFLPAYKGGSIKAWIRRITVNTFYSSMRSRKDAVSLDQEPTLFQLIDPNLSTSGEVGRRQQKMRIERAIAELPEDSRHVLVLRDYEDLEYQEIATRLGVPVGTVRSRLSRARQALRKSLEAGETSASRQGSPP